MNRGRVEREWKARGFTCGLWTDPPGQVWTNYVHTVDELFMVVEGDVELEMRGRAFHPAIGEEVLIPAGVAHTVRNIGSTTARWLYGYRRGEAAG
jgi:mannose-6-phosphate isomerase-like protein (cupin superfamily)